MMFLVVFVGRKMVMDISFGGVLFPPPFNMCANFLSLLFLCLLWHGWLPGPGGIVHDDPWAFFVI